MAVVRKGVGGGGERGAGSKRRCTRRRRIALSLWAFLGPRDPRRAGAELARPAAERLRPTANEATPVAAPALTDLVRATFGEPDPNRVHWLTLLGRTSTVVLRSAPIEVGLLLREQGKDKDADAARGSVA